MLDGETKMQINFENAHIRHITFFIRLQKLCINYDGNTFAQ